MFEILLFFEHHDNMNESRFVVEVNQLSRVLINIRKKTKLENYLKQTRMDNNDQMYQYCWNYITAIICF